MVPNTKGVFHARRNYHSNNSPVYTGIMSAEQVVGKSLVDIPIYEDDRFSPYQEKLLSRALQGLKACSQEELQYMHWEKRKRIQKVHKRAQAILNQLRQQLMITYTNNWLQQLFFDSDWVKEIITNFSDEEPEEKINFDLKDLGVRKEFIVKTLIQTKVLPPNFYDLKQDPNPLSRLPRLKKPKTVKA